MDLIGYALSIVMGFILGLLGGGGSILTVPILVYVLAINPLLATGYSLFVVGSTSVVGALIKASEKFVDWKTAVVFAVPSLLAVFATRYYVIPAIPEEIVRINDLVVTNDIAVMIFFAAIMLVASHSMIRRPFTVKRRSESEFRLSLVILEGLIVGFFTGLVGAGGGFLIVPALVLLGGLPIKKAVGTSLVIIALKSLIGFLGDIGTGRNIEWSFLLLFTGFSVLGMFLGTYATRFFSADKLKKGFGWFVLLMAVFIIVKEVISAS